MAFFNKLLEWITEMDYPDEDDPDWEGKMFKAFLKDPDHFRNEEAKKIKNRLHALRDTTWAAMIASRDGNSAPILDLVREASLSDDLRQYILSSDNLRPRPKLFL